MAPKKKEAEGEKLTRIALVSDDKVSLLYPVASSAVAHRFSSFIALVQA
jgi:hypothetical protein